jgi:hypothetical protein
VWVIPIVEYPSGALVKLVEVRWPPAGHAFRSSAALTDRVIDVVGDLARSALLDDPPRHHRPGDGRGGEQAGAAERETQDGAP